MCIHAYAHTYHKKIKLFLILGKSKIKIFELLFIYYTLPKQRVILIGANLLPSIFSLRSKKQICICSHSLTREHKIAHFIRSMLSHTHLGVKIVLFCVLCLICYPSSPPQSQKNTKICKKPQISKISILGGGVVG